MAASIQHIDRDGGTVITAENWPDAFAGANNQPRKFAVQNNGTRGLGAGPVGPTSGAQIEVDAIGVNDGFSMAVIAGDTATLSPPYGLTAVLGSTGGGNFVAVATYGWKVAARNANGETIGSFEADFAIPSTSAQVALAWTTIPGATNYAIYRSSSPGTFTSSVPAVMCSTIGAVGLYTDTGGFAVTSSPAVVNQTGSWVLTAALILGTGGAWAATGPEFWTLVAFDATGVVISVSTEAFFNVTNVAQQVRLTWPNVLAAASYTLYRTTTSGSYPSPSIVATLAAGVTTFTDTGAATTTGANVNLNSYGIPPATLSTSPTIALPIQEGSVAIGQMAFYWVNRVIPPGTAEAGNPRDFNITFKEI